MTHGGCGFNSNLEYPEHSVPENAQCWETKFCQCCGKCFLRQAHKPGPSEELILRMLSEAQDPEFYALLRRELSELRGARYCRGCNRSFTPVSERVH